MKHFISVDEWSNAEIMNIFHMADRFRRGKYTIESQVFAANLFFEPSTRTKTSFMMAERKLGMEVLEFSPETSSMQKGETLYDTVKTFEAIGTDVLIIRHQEDEWINMLEQGISIPIINAGAGKKEHPTQCILDADTIYQEFGKFSGLNVVIAGDIVHSRVAQSNAKFLSRLGANIYFTGEPMFMDESLPFPYLTMDEAIEIADVMMLLRIQHERHHGDLVDLRAYHERHGLTVAREKRMKDQAIIMHPAPVNRGVEIDSSLVECERSRIFKQMTNGVYSRMAVLTTQLIQWGIIHENQINQCNQINGQQARAM